MKLDVFIEHIEAPIGILERRTDKSMVFKYLSNAPEDARISLALPVTDETYGDAACVAYFGNLLFESRELDRVRNTHKIDRDDIAGLLAHLGVDCPGAISVMPAGKRPIKRPGIFPDDYDQLTEDQIKSIVISLHFDGALPKGSRDPSPIAGVQPKLAVLYFKNTFYLPKAGTGAPTTHILKVSPRETPSITRHEVALMKLASKLGIDAAQSEHMAFEDDSTSSQISTILSTRFDRIFDGITIQRIHSEDFCQALGIAKDLKYERDGNDAVRFSAEGIGLIAKQVAVPALFQQEFLRHTIFNLGVGNTDNHGKNGALLYDTPSGRLAPLYDVVPVTMEKEYSHEFSFKIGEASYAEDLSEIYLNTMMQDFGFARPQFNGQIKKQMQPIAQVGVPFLHQHGSKKLADAIAAQLGVIEKALNVDLGVPDRDYCQRNVRDENTKSPAGGWGSFS